MTNTRIGTWPYPVFIAVFFGVCIRIILMVVTPVGSDEHAGRLSSYNDEIAHIHYVEYVLENSTLPSQVESIQSTEALLRGLYENYQPPLFYLLTAGSAKLIGCTSTLEIAYVGRLLSLCCSFAIIWIALNIADVLQLGFFHRSALILFWALNGVFVRFTASVGNDALFWFLGGGMIYCSLTLDRKDFSFWNAVLFVIFAVAALYTKLNALLLLPLPLVAFRHKQPVRTKWLLTGVFALIIGLTIPLWMRNINVFGSLIPLDAGFGQAESRYPDWRMAAYIVRSFFFPWHELWYGYVGITLMLPALCFLLWSLRTRLNLHSLFRYPVLFVSIVLVVLAFVWLNMRYDQAEARYLFAAWPVIAVGLSPSNIRPMALWFLLIAYLLPYALLFPSLFV